VNGATETDARWMQRALELAVRGRYGTSPNPMVGAVVVDAQSRLAGEGFHATFGGPHAETVALGAAAQRARDGTLYVTLEPCAHFGKTPPCTDAIVAAGVRRVVIALRDPSPTAGGGVERLREHGIAVDMAGDREARAARTLNRRWLRWAEDRRPWVTLKAAVSLDGRIATATGQSQWITSSEARRRGLEMREEHDAMLVGVGTVLADNPLLTRRLGLARARAWRRVILDSTLRTPSHANVVSNDPELTVIAHTEAAPTEERYRLERAGVTLVSMPSHDGDLVDVESLLRWLADHDVAALLVEGGARVHGSFADAGLVDEAVFFVAPMILGGAAPCAVAGRGVAELARATRLRFESCERFGDDLELRAVTVEDASVHRIG